MPELHNGIPQPIWVRERDKVSTESSFFEGLPAADFYRDWVKGKLIDVDTDKGEFVFRCVGIIRYRSRLFYCLPKYWADDSIIGQPFNGESAAHQAAMQHFSTLLNVVRKYKNKAYEDNADRAPETEDGLLVLMVRLVTDYAENGLYRDDTQVDELSPPGRILWQKSINSQLPVIQEDDPVYMALYHRRTVEAERHFLARLHHLIVRESYEIMASFGLTELLQLPDVDECEDSLDDLGGREYAEYRLNTELTQQFDSRRRYLLRMMLDYIEQSGEEQSAEAPILFGTSSFEQIWEEVCRCALGHDLHAEERWQKPYKRSQPTWELDGNKAHEAQSQRTDMIFHAHDNAGIELYDAKYFMPNADLNGLPGVNDICKQYVYQLTLIHHEWEKPIRNALLLPAPTPGEQGEAPSDSEQWGHVSMAVMKELGLGDIYVYRLSPPRLYELYLAERTFSLVNLSEPGGSMNDAVSSSQDSAVALRQFYRSQTAESSQGN